MSDLVKDARAAAEILRKHPCEVYRGAQLYSELTDEIERLRAEVAAYERLIGGMKQMIKSFEGCSVIGRYKPYASEESGKLDAQ